MRLFIATDYCGASCNNIIEDVSETERERDSAGERENAKPIRVPNFVIECFSCNFLNLFAWLVFFINQCLHISFFAVYNTYYTCEVVEEKENEEEEWKAEKKTKSEGDDQYVYI